MDYNKFSLMESNRKVRKPHVKRLVAMLEMFPRMSEWLPILVNERYQIADGQHRFFAAQELNIPINYLLIEGLTIEDARRLNAGAKPWTPMDYAECFCSGGKKPYCLYVELKKAFRFNHDILLRLISLEDPITGEAFKQGRLTSPDITRTRTLCEYVQSLQKITGNIHRGLAFAFMELIAEGYNPEKLVKSVSKFYRNGSRIEPYKDTDEYARVLRTIA